MPNASSAMISMDSGIGFMGPSYSISAACATANHCLLSAADQIMESLEHAMQREAPIFAEYLGGASTCDAYHLTDPRPEGRGIAMCITESRGRGRRARGASSPAGDLAEVDALKQVFRNSQQKIKVNATKSMIGHCLGAAGGLEAVATIKAITTGWVHPTINQFNPDPACAVDHFGTVPHVKQKHNVNVGISNSFGFGGHNSVAVFAPYMHNIWF
ncbi:hypothetical protein PR202_ga28939 [Eleusine coracana subsp. coracana]|uniref:beta-ketoacyl-[acyl-carrier-protein] synthase I n=1 Tax=Eleusine coracana subsp. coracana TaxID=191504 RepID=A0AAV5DL36_ELECO|nr:hypothetical protein PR202_ga28939 [Eleusine coracana subsp. coracana]